MKKTDTGLPDHPDKAVLRIQISNGIREDCSGIASNQIGLKSVQKIIRLHHGTVLAEKEGQRFAVTLTLPLSESDPDPRPDR